MRKAVICFYYIHFRQKLYVILRCFPSYKIVVLFNSTRVFVYNNNVSIMRCMRTVFSITHGQTWPMVVDLETFNKVVFCRQITRITLKTTRWRISIRTPSGNCTVIRKPMTVQRLKLFYDVMCFGHGFDHFPSYFKTFDKLKPLPLLFGNVVFDIVYVKYCATMLKRIEGYFYFLCINSYIVFLNVEDKRIKNLRVVGVFRFFIRLFSIIWNRT